MGCGASSDAGEGEFATPSPSRRQVRGDGASSSGSGDLDGVGAGGTVGKRERRTLVQTVPDGVLAVGVADPKWVVMCHSMGLLAEDAAVLVSQGVGMWLAILMRQEHRENALFGALRALHEWKYRNTDAMEAAVQAEGERGVDGDARASVRAVKDMVVTLTRDLGVLLVTCLRNDDFLKDNGAAGQLWGYCAEVLHDHLLHLEQRDPLLPRRYWAAVSHENDPVRHCLRAMRVASARFSKVGGDFESTSLTSIASLDLLPLCVKVLERMGTREAGTEYIDPEGCKDTIKFLSYCCDSEIFRQESALSEDSLIKLDDWMAANAGSLGDGTATSSSRRMLRPVQSFVLREKLRTGISKPPDV